MHLVQRLLSLRENKGSWSEEAHSEGFPASGSGGAELRRFGRGASLPANPCSFVHKHHVSRAQSAGGVPDVVPHSPQTLIPSSGSTTSLGSNGTSTSWTWCLTPRKPLFLRPEAPRPQVRMGRRPHRRGALSPTSPCSFVRKHHVPRSGWADAGTDVVLHPPQTPVFSSGSTTSPGPDGPTPALTWCFTPRNPLFLRFLCTKSLVFFGASTLRTWCKDSRKTLFLRFLCTKSLALFGAPTP